MHEFANIKKIDVIRFRITEITLNCCYLKAKMKSMLKEKYSILIKYN